MTGLLKLTADVVDYDAATGVLTIDGHEFPVALKDLKNIFNTPNEEDVITLSFAYRTFTVHAREF